MNDLNNLTIIGRLTDNPVYKPEIGKGLATFKIASNKKYGDKEEVLFLQCECWSGLSKIVNDYTHKGDKIALSGRLKSHAWETKEGQKRTDTILVVNEINLLSGKKESDSQPDSASAQVSNAFADDEAF